MFFVSLGEKPLVFSFYKGVCTCKCKTNIVWFFLPFPNDLTKNTYGSLSHLSTYLTTYLPASENTLKEQCWRLMNFEILITVMSNLDNVI